MKTVAKTLIFLAIALLYLPLSAQVVQDLDYSILLENTLKHTVPHMYVSDVNPNQTNVVYLDAREKDEFKVSHVKGSIWVGYSDFDMERVKDVPKNAQIVVYCSIGVRSEEISEKLIQAGYLNTKNLYGGIFEWVNQGYPVYKKKSTPTQDVHAYDQTWGKWLSQGNKVY